MVVNVLLLETDRPSVGWPVETVRMVGQEDLGEDRLWMKLGVGLRLGLGWRWELPGALSELLSEFVSGVSSSGAASRTISGMMGRVVVGGGWLLSSWLGWLWNVVVAGMLLLFWGSGCGYAWVVSWVYWAYSWVFS